MLLHSWPLASCSVHESLRYLRKTTTSDNDCLESSRNKHNKTLLTSMFWRMQRPPSNKLWPVPTAAPPHAARTNYSLIRDSTPQSYPTSRCIFDPKGGHNLLSFSSQHLLSQPTGEQSKMTSLTIHLVRNNAFTTHPTTRAAMAIRFPR